MKKIMIFIPRMGSGGAERFVSHLSNYYSENCQVRIVTIVSKNSFYDLNANVCLVSADLEVYRGNRLIRGISKLRNFYKAYMFLAKSITEYEPDVVFSFLVECDIIMHIFKQHRMYKFKHICSERNDPRERNPLLRNYLSKIYSFSDMLVCQTLVVKNYYKKIPNHKKIIIPNPIDLSLIPKATEERKEIRFVAIGRLDSQKNFKMLIYAFKRVCEVHENIQLVIYGEGKQRKKLEAYISNLQLNSKVIMPGSSPTVLEQIKDATCFILSSDYEGYPNALAEAMACGLPVISTDFSTGAARQLIQSENGILVRTKDIVGLSNAMIEILKSKTEREKMRTANRKKMEEFDIKKIIPRWMDLI